jgi:hypothetical protein
MKTVHVNLKIKIVLIVVLYTMLFKMSSTNHSLRRSFQTQKYCENTLQFATKTASKLSELCLYFKVSSSQEMLEMHGN